MSLEYTIAMLRAFLSIDILYVLLYVMDIFSEEKIKFILAKYISIKQLL